MVRMLPFLLFVLLAGASAQSQTSCLIQRLADSSRSLGEDVTAQDSPFSAEQRKCIDAYGASVEAELPGYTERLRKRKFGGMGIPDPDGSVILGAGFGTTATRSLAAFARQLGLKVHHYHPNDDPQDLWQQLESLTKEEQPGGISSCVERVNAVNFSEAFDHGYGLLLDTPIAELFLDFYALRPRSKVMLTSRDSSQWVKARLQFDNDLHAPVHNPCGLRLAALGAESAARVFEAHTQLVRCIVPAEKLMEISVWEPSSIDPSALSEFFGFGKPKYPMLYPRVMDKVPDHGPASLANVKVRDMAAKVPEVGICVTGQIRRLEVRTKVERLIGPLQQAGFYVTVALVIDPRTETKYVHRASGKNIGGYTLVDGNFSSLEEAAKMFGNNVSLLGESFIPRDYPVDERYVQDLIQQHPEHEPAYHRARAISHMRQWEALARCGHVLAATGPGRPFNYTLRLRDDSSVMEPFVLPANLTSDRLYVPDCASCGGINDKMALSAGDGVAQKYFNMPLATMRSSFDQLWQYHKSVSGDGMAPEIVLDLVFRLQQVPLEKLRPDDLPIVPSKYLRKGHKTFLCYPAESDNYYGCYSSRVYEHLQQIGFEVREVPSNTSARPDFICEKEPVQLAH